MAEQKSDDGANVYRIKAVPKTKPTKEDNFELTTGQKLAELKDGEILIEPEYISVDPYQRGRMPIWFKTESKQMQSFAVAKVLKSKSDKYKEGQFVYCNVPWSSKQILPGDSQTIFSVIPPDLSQYKPKDDPDYNEGLDTDDSKFDVAEIKNISHSKYVGAYGMPGQTAYYGMIYRGGLKKGDNVLVSGAAGAVGSLCGQIAKIMGCYAVGICGTPEKIKFITEDCGFDKGINYKNYRIGKKVGDVEIANPKVEFEQVQKALKDAFPNGIDLYFDNVGGVFTEAVWDLLNPHARVIVCGQIASYNDDKDNPNLIRPFLHKTIYKEIDIRGIIVTNFKNKPKFYYDMGKWIATGKVKVKETVVEGFEKLPDAFIGLFEGVNTGKMVVKCT